MPLELGKVYNIQFGTNVGKGWGCPLLAALWSAGFPAAAVSGEWLNDLADLDPLYLLLNTNHSRASKKRGDQGRQPLHVTHPSVTHSWHSISQLPPYPWFCIRIQPSADGRALSYLLLGKKNHTWSVHSYKIKCKSSERVWSPGEYHGAGTQPRPRTLSKVHFS